MPLERLLPGQTGGVHGLEPDFCSAQMRPYARRKLAKTAICQEPEKGGLELLAVNIGF
jgi:hypothetical protein